MPRGAAQHHIPSPTQSKIAGLTPSVLLAHPSSPRWKETPQRTVRYIPVLRVLNRSLSPKNEAGRTGQNNRTNKKKNKKKERKEH